MVKKMVRFKELGFSSFEQYKQHFFQKLILSNKTYDYFVDWEKVRALVGQYLNELSLLNSLTKVDISERNKHMENLIIKYPQVVEVLPFLIAERVKNGKLNIFDPELEQIVVFEFKKEKISREIAAKIVEFCNKTGIMNLFQQTKDVHDYLLGVEVGIDTNARKNRSGEIFEKMCQNKMATLLRTEYMPIFNDPNFSLYSSVSKKSKGKTHDIVVYKNHQPMLIVECNFYNTTGSKPISIAESYVEMNRVAKEKGIDFLWVTDGPGWYEMKEPLIRSMENMDWILNFSMLELIVRILP